MNRRVINRALATVGMVTLFQLGVLPAAFAQTFLPGAIVTFKTIDLNGNIVSVDSFNSSDPTKSTNGQYDPTKAQDNGDLFANLGITNSIPGGVAGIFGHVHTSPTTNVPSLGQGGGIGSASWRATHTGIQPGWWLQDANFTVPVIKYPDTSSFLTPTNGWVTNMVGTYMVGAYYDNILWGNANYTNSYVATSLSGQTLVEGPNVVLAMPDGLNMSGADSFTLWGGTNIFGANSARASIVIYSGGTICSIGGNGVVNEPGFAQDFLLSCSSTVTNCTLSGNAVFKGVIFAPSADVNMDAGGNNNVDFVGCLVANSLLLNGNFNFHYDEALFGTILPPARCVPPPVALTTWWSCDGNASDVTGHNDGIISGGAAFVPGKVGQAIALNGVDAYIRTNTVATTNIDNWSMTTWVNWQGLVGSTNKTRQTLLYNGNEESNGYGLIIPEEGICTLDPSLCSEVGKLVIAFGGVDYIQTGAALDQNAWDHITLARENGVIKLYQDATLVFANPSSNPNPPSASDGYITVGTSPDYAFNGFVDEIMICKTALPGDQVAALFSAGGLGACKPLIFDFITQTTNGWTTLALSGQAGKELTLYTSPDLLTWSPFATNSNPQGACNFTDTTSANAPTRFYKATAQ